jgi:hypothetical protein
MKNIAIVCEGKADKEFFDSLIEHLVENKIISLYETTISFYILGGKSNFLNIENKNYKELQSEVFMEKTAKILFVIDADDVINDTTYGGYENTENALNEIITQLDFQDISSTYIMCDPITKIGYLESFILSSIPERQRNCIERFLECSQFKSKENHKAILNKIYNIAYPNAPYDFAHPHFEELKAKLHELFSGLD